MKEASEFAIYRLWTVLGVVLLISGPSLAQETAASILEKSAEANRRDWAAATQFDNDERDIDKNGDKTYRVTMLFGSPYQRLIAVNGHDLSSGQQEEEQKKYEDAVQQRQHESPAQRSQRIAKYEADRKRDQTLIDQMTSAFDFSLLGEKELMGRQVYVLKATIVTAKFSPEWRARCGSTTTHFSG